MAYIIEFLKAVFEDQLKPGATFLDCGSGIGKALLTAGLCFPFSKCVGYEYIEKLESLGDSYLRNFDFSSAIINNPDLFKDYVIKPVSDKKSSKKSETHLEENKVPTFLIPEILIIGGSFLKESWENFDVVFINSTTYSDELMSQITEKTKELKEGAILITVTRRIMEAKKIRWRLYDGFKRRMSWGPATIYIHQVREQRKKKKLDNVSVN